MSDTEEGFTVRDRRSTIADETPTAAPSTVAAPISSPIQTVPDIDDPADFDAQENDGSLPDIYSVLALFMSELRGMAWLRMGLVANPVTNQIERDMEQARVAIDTVAFLAQQLDAVVSPEEKLPLKAMVSDLQINFVEQSKRGG